MSIVIDTSVIMAVIANEPEKNQIIALTSGSALIAPHSVHWEIGNAFSAMYKRGKISMEQALKAIEIYRQISLRYVDIDLVQSLKLSAQYGICAYDAYLIQCARTYRSSLITLDKGLNFTAIKAGVRVIEVLK